MDGKIVIKKQTSYHGKVLLPGDRITVPLRVEERWVRNSIAQYVPDFEIPTIKSFEKSSLVVKALKKNKLTSIIIPAYGCLHFLRDCIDSIVRHTNNYEIIVIDNDTPDTPIKKHIEILSDFDLTIITNEKNMGFGYACNQGIKVAKYDYICFLNSDTLVTLNWLYELQKCFIKKEKVSFASPTTCHSRGKQCDNVLYRKAHLMTGTDIVEYTDTLQEGFEQTEIYGFCMLAKKGLFEKVGVFDYKRYGLGNCEEGDLQWRAEKFGYKSYWVKGAYVHHYGHETYKKFKIDPNLRFNENVFEKRKSDKNLFIENDVIVDDAVKVDKPKFKKTIDSKKIGFVPRHNIHALCFRIAAGTRIRVLNIVKHLKNCIVSYNFEDLKTCKVVIFQARWSNSDIELARKLKDHGVKLILDTTDLHWDTVNFDLQGKSKKALDKILKFIDIVTFPTEGVKKSFLEYRQDKRIEIIPDCIDLSKHTGIREHKKKDNYTIVWYGCRSNVCQIDIARQDLEKLGKEFNLRLLAIYDKFLGVDVKPFDNLKLETRDWTDDETIKAILESDLAINPRYDNWKNYKSNNKTIKALALGVPCVEKDFYTNIKKYLLSASLRNSDGEKGKEIAKRFDSKKIAKKLARLCDDLTKKYKRKNKIAVVTAIAGGFDFLHDPKYYDRDVDYFAYIDSDEKSDIWQVNKIEYTHFTQPRMTAKIYKLLIHKFCDYDYTLWIDGALEMKAPIGELVDRFMGKYDMALFKHRIRDCIYEEHFASFKNTRHAIGEPKSVREKRTERYKAEGMPVKYGLYECTFILRKNNAKIRKFNNEWTEEVLISSSSDQIPFMYVLWKNPGIKVATITPGHAHDSKWAKYIEHGQR